MAGAPYFGGEFTRDTPGISNWSVEQLLDSVDVRMLSFDSGPYWAEQTIELLESPPYSDYGLEYIAYEGGQHLFNFNGSPEDPESLLFIEANRHPRMGGMYTRYLDWWKNAGGRLFTLYTHSAQPVFGSFGLLEYLEQDTLTAPKWMAVQEWIRDNCPEIAAGVEDEPEQSVDFSLSQNYPNPFNTTTNIEFSMADPGLATLKIYDVLGREIATLVNEQKQPGTYNIEFDASGLSSGLYFYQLRTGGFIDTKKLVLLK